jgi:hypothetical protein
VSAVRLACKGAQLCARGAVATLSVLGLLLRPALAGCIDARHEAGGTG